MIVVERRIERPCEAVFQVLADGWVYSGWVVGASTIRHVDAHWPQPGAQIHHAVGIWPLVVEDISRAVSAEPPHRLVLQAFAWPFGEARIVLELHPLEDGACLVRMSEDVSTGTGRLLPYPLRRLVLQPRNRECLRRLDLLSGRYS